MLKYYRPLREKNGEGEGVSNRKMKVFSIGLEYWRGLQRNEMPTCHHIPFENKDTIHELTFKHGFPFAQVANGCGRGCGCV